jgi:molybdopterin-guanine dinucleotide biosynthesis protein A
MTRATDAPNSSTVTGVLLVGGASTRFGSPKALARLGDETLAERTWRALAWCDERLAVGKTSDALPLPFPILDDECETRAPLAGVVAGLRLACGELCVFLPVDCPNVTPALLQTLVGACAEAAVPATGPLPGVYRRSVLPVLESRLAQGQLALREALAEVDSRVVDVDPALLSDVDTQAALQALTSAAGLR